jgi:hypothetical protein
MKNEEVYDDVEDFKMARSTNTDEFAGEFSSDRQIG